MAVENKPPVQSASAVSESLASKAGGNPLALALSTALGRAQLAVFDPKGRIVFELEIANYQDQSARLLGELSENLRLHGLTGASIDVLAVNVGPGGFTSLRTACGVGQGLAAAWGTKCLLINSFDMVAEAAKLKDQSAGRGIVAARSLAVVLDAKLGELYFARSSGTEKPVTSKLATVPTSDPAADSVTPGAWAEMKLVSQKPEILTEFLEPFDLILTDTEAASSLFKPAGLADRVRVADVQPASMIGPVLRAWEAGEFHDPFAFQPLYIREKVAETTQERLARKHG